MTFIFHLDMKICYSAYVFKYLSCALVRKDQCEPQAVADVVKAVVVKGGDLPRAGECRVCHRRGFRCGQSPSPVPDGTSLITDSLNGLGWKGS